jgi:hypothetical protein
VTQRNETATGKATPASAETVDVAAGLQPRARTAAQLGVSVRTLVRWEQAEGLPVIAVGRLRLHDPCLVHAWLTRKTRKPEPPRGRGRPRKRAVELRAGAA